MAMSPSEDRLKKWGLYAQLVPARKPLFDDADGNDFTGLARRLPAEVATGAVADDAKGGFENPFGDQPPPASAVPFFAGSTTIFGTVLLAIRQVSDSA